MNGIGLKNRIIWIDLAKAIGIILVIIGHGIQKYNLNMDFLEVVIYSMHMPLFFLLSGYVFKYNDEIKFKEIANKKLKKIIIPYFIFIIIITFFHFLKCIVLKSDYEFFQKMVSKEGCIQNILCTTKSSYSNLWFLPSLFISEILFLWIFKVFREEKKRAIICISLSMIIVYVKKYIYITALPFCMESAIYALMYLYIGYYFRRNDVLNKIQKKHTYILGIIFLVANLVYYYILRGKPFNFYNLDIKYPIIFFITAVSGTICLIKICMRLKENSVLQYIGRNTLYIYGLHFIFQNVISIIASKILIEEISVLMIIVTTILNLIMCLITIRCFNIVKRKLGISSENINN